MDSISRGDHQRHPARRRAGAAGARAQPDLRRHRRGVDRLRRHRHVRHVRDLFPVRAVMAGRCRSPAWSRSSASPALGVLVHLLIIAPVLNSAPINQLLATGGLLFFLQSFATLLFGTDFRNIGIRLPILEVGTIYISFARLIAFGVGAGRRGRALSLPQAHLYRHRDPRHRAGPRHRRPDGRRPAPDLSGDLGDRRRAGRPRGLPAGAAI